LIVDFHVHIFPPEVCRGRDEYRCRDRHFEALYASGKAKLITAEELIRAMDASGVDSAVTLNFGWSTPDLCQETNDYILDAARRYPGRLIPFCTVQPKSGLLARREIERCRAAGAQGIGELMPDAQEFDLGDRDVMREVAEAAKEAGIPVLTHASEPVGHAYPGKGKTTPDLLVRFVQNFPDLTVVLAHLGGGLPFYALMPEVSKALKNVYFDTAAQPFLYQPAVYRLLAELVGADKVLFGSDYPLLGFKRYIKEISALDLTDHCRELILGGNALQLLAQVGKSEGLFGSRSA